MPKNTKQLTVEDLLKNNPWVRNLALSLLYDKNMVRLDQMGWSQNPVYFPDECMMRSPDGSGPADGYDWITSGGDISLFYDVCPLMSPVLSAGNDLSPATGLGSVTPNPSKGPMTLDFAIAEREGVGD